jgi:hypothetical protein
MLIPLPKSVTARLSYPTIEEYSNITLATLFNINFYRLIVVTALASNKKIILNKSILVYLTYYYYVYNNPGGMGNRNN